MMSFIGESFNRGSSVVQLQFSVPFSLIIDITDYDY